MSIQFMFVFYKVLFLFFAFSFSVAHLLKDQQEFFSAKVAYSHNRFTS
jgi:hypothetical protein